jgi:hypothetical protein
MLALSEYDANTCGGCGGQLDETTSEDAHAAWEVPPPDRCYKCTALGHVQDRFRKTNKETGMPLTPQAHALKFKVHRIK